MENGFIKEVRIFLEATSLSAQVLAVLSTIPTAMPREWDACITSRHMANCSGFRLSKTRICESATVIHHSPYWLLAISSAPESTSHLHLVEQG